MGEEKDLILCPAGYKVPSRLEEEELGGGVAGGDRQECVRPFDMLMSSHLLLFYSDWVLLGDAGPPGMLMEPERRIRARPDTPMIVK